MVSFITFNEQSIPLSGIPCLYEQNIGDFLKIIHKLSNNYSINQIRAEKKIVDYACFAGKKDAQAIINTIKDRNLKSLFCSFLANRNIEFDSPLIKDEEQKQADDFCNKSYFFNGEPNNGGFACADIWQTACISFKNEPWDVSEINLVFDKTNTVQIPHLSSLKHIDIHHEFLKKYISISRTIGDILKLAKKTNSELKYKVKFLNIAEQQLEDHYSDQLFLIKSLDKILREIKQSLDFGLGKSERLKGDHKGWSSRRITQEHRLIYKLENKIIIIKSCYGHYT